MNRWTHALLLAALGLAMTGGPLVVPLAAQQPGSNPEQLPTPPQPRLAPDQQAAGALAEAYDTITLTAIWIDSGKAQTDLDYKRLGEHAIHFYQEARKAYDNKNYARATALAAAANDAAGGILLVLRATTPTPVANLPAPPEAAGGGPGEAGAGTSGEARTPKEGVRRMLVTVRQRVIDAGQGDVARGRAKPFIEAARRAYEHSRRAYQDGDYAKAGQLGAALGAWLQVGEDLRQADNPGPPQGEPGGLGGAGGGQPSPLPDR